MSIFDQDNTSVVRKQPSQLFWDNGKINRIVTPITEDRLTADKRDWSTRQFNKLTESPIGQLYSKAEQIPVVNFVLPSTEGLSNFVDNRSSAWNKATGALEAVPLLAGAGYKGFKTVNKLNSKFLDQSNSLLKSLPNRQTMDYNNNVEALTALQKFSDEKGYGLRNAVHYAKDQNKTDAAIREIMNRNNTFVRGVSAPDKETAIKYLTEVTPKTGHGTDRLLPNEHANYSSNSVHNAIGYAGPNGYYGKIRLPVDYNSTNRINWINKNKNLPTNIIPDPYPSVIRNNDLISEVSNRANKLYGNGNLISEDLASMADEPEYLNDIYGNLFGAIKDKYEPLTKFKHYITKGNPGDKPFNLIDIKKVNPKEWNYSTAPQAQWKHQGEYSSGLSLAGSNVVGAKLIDNLKALSSLQKFSDEKGYGLKNIIHYAEDQDKTDAVIKEIMNRNRTFTRGVEAANKSDAIKYLTEVPGNTGSTRHGLPEGKTGIYTTNSRMTSEPYTKGRGYVGDVRIPSDFSSNSRLQWVESNKELPSNVVKRVWDSNKYPANIESRLSPADIALDDIKKFGELADKVGVDSKEYSMFKNKENEARQLFESIKSKHRNVFKETNPNNNTYNHYIIQGEPGQKLLDVVNIKEINPSNWNQRIRTHHGEYSQGLSLAGMFGLSTANQDSIFNK